MGFCLSSLSRQRHGFEDRRDEDEPSNSGNIRFVDIGIAVN